MNGILMMIGFGGTSGIMTEFFLSKTLEPTGIERFDTVDEVCATHRGEPVDCIACYLYSLGDAIEERLRRLYERFPESRLACFSDYPVTDAIALRCKRGGGQYLIFNLATNAELARFSAAFSANRPYYPESIAGIDEKTEQTIVANAIRLPARQLDIFRRALTGQSGKVTAIELGISDKTVATHRKRYVRKLRTANSWELLAKAFCLNLISPLEVFRSHDADEK